jgi:hypothetical protein
MATITLARSYEECATREELARRWGVRCDVLLSEYDAARGRGREDRDHALVRLIEERRRYHRAAERITWLDNLRRAGAL